MDWLQLVILSLIQGITEFLPISSSAHLVLPAQLTDWPDQGLAFDVGVHFGTLLAVLVYFREDLRRMATSTLSWPATRRYDTDLDLVLKLALATLPVAVAGYLGKDLVEDHLRTVPVIICTTMGFAVLLWWSDRKPGSGETVSWHHALIVGVAQVLALVPGTSRSGITITAALLVGLSRTAASRFSFLLAIPTIAGAQLLLTLDLLNAPEDRAFTHIAVAAMLAGIAAYLCIHYFIRLVERTGMTPYVIYRLALGTVLLALLYLQ